MDEKKVAELRKFVAAIANPKVRPFIDLVKLGGSGTFNLAVQMATEHASIHGDFGYLNSLLAVLGDGTQASQLIAGLRPKLSFVVSETKPRKLKKATTEQAAADVKKAFKPAAPVKSKPQTPKPKESPNRKRSDDLLDSRLMLPGAYGTGKRR